ncbi:MAG: kelch repeat-containing protein [Planctomycetota bacterium JB042]
MKPRARLGPIGALCVALHAVSACDEGAARATVDTPDSALRSRRVLATATPTVAGRIVVAGGLEDSHDPTSARGDAEILDPFHGEGAGRVLPPTPLSGRIVAGRAGHAAVALSGGRVLLVGGDLAGTVELFDPDLGPSGRFRPIGALPGGARMASTATLLDDDLVLVTGGLTPARRACAFVSIVDVKHGTIEALAPLSEARASHTATRLVDGRVLVAGGVGRRSTELFDPATRRFAPGPSLRHVRDDHRATRLADGSVLVTGGQDARGRSRRTSERFVPGDDAFVSGPDLTSARADHAQVLLADGRVVLLGGEDDDGRNVDVVLDAVEAFDPDSSRFVPLAPLSMPRDDHAAVVLRDGRICVVGGQTTGDRALRAVEYYRPRPR